MEWDNTGRDGIRDGTIRDGVGYGMGQCGTGWDTGWDGMGYGMQVVVWQNIHTEKAVTTLH